MFSDKIKDMELGDTVWDNEDKGSVRGLHARRHSRGISFLIYYTNRAGVERRPKIGEFPEMDIQTARKIATNIRARVALGEDPKGDWNDLKATPTISGFYKSVEADLFSESSAQSGWKDEAHRLFIKDVAPFFGGLKLTEIDAPMVRAWHRSFETKAKTTGNRALAVLSKIFSRAQDDGYIQWGDNPCLRVKKFKEEPRERFATLEEIQKIGALLKKYESNFKLQVAFLRLLIFTGARPTVWERAKWQDIRHKNGGTVLRSEGKSGFDEIILTKEAMDILSSLPAGELDQYILGIFMPKKFWNRIRKEAGCEDLWARDWRRTFASVAKEQGISMDKIADILGHRTIQTTLVYAKAVEGAKAKNAELASSTMANLINSKPST